MAHKTYTGPEVGVTFDGEVCRHAAGAYAACRVFDIDKRPWINPAVADTPELAQHLRDVISRCPSVRCASWSIPSRHKGLPRTGNP